MILKMLKIPKNLESKGEKNNNKRRKERPNIKYKLIRLKKKIKSKKNWRNLIGWW